jgi:hypothetical protein
MMNEIMIERRKGSDGCREVEQRLIPNFRVEEYVYNLCMTLRFTTLHAHPLSPEGWSHSLTVQTDLEVSSW